MRRVVHHDHEWCVMRPVHRRLDDATGAGVQHRLVGIGDQALGALSQDLDLLAGFPRRRGILAGKTAIGLPHAANAAKPSNVGFAVI
jgi:hypothetical protein